MKRISCEVCGSNDLLKQDGVFICQNCNCKYSAEEIKKQLVEVTNPVQVVGVDNADTMYDRALDWLNLNNTAKAIEVLSEMTEKYPGDKRGWQKLARLKPTRETVDNAIRLGDNELLEEWRAAAQEACADIRSGRGEKWVRGNQLLVNEHSIYGLFPCVRELYEEGQKEAKYFNEYCANFRGTSKIFSRHKLGYYWQEALYILWIGVLDSETPRSEIAFGDVNFIMKNIIVYKRDKIRRAFICNKTINRPLIQQTFQEIETLILKKRCPFCGNKYSFFNNSYKDHHCPDCKNYVPWFYYQ